MKITGTKKLLILFFAILCALAVGLGVMISRSGAPSYAYDGSAVGEIDYAEDTSSDEAEEIDPDVEDGQEEVDPAVQDGEEKKEKLVSEEYDERFDEGIIQQISVLMGVKPEFLSLYFHLNQIDAREYLAILAEEDERVSALPHTTVFVGHESDDEDYVNPDGVSGFSAKEDKEQEEPKDPYLREFNENFYDELFQFQTLYRRNEIAIPEGVEDSDWFIPPDDCGAYVNYRYLGYMYQPALNNQGYTIPNVGSGIDRTIHHPETSTYNSTAQQLLYWQYYVQLAPGQTYTVSRKSDNGVWVAYRLVMSYTANDHWAYVVSNDWAQYGPSTFVIDGDAPTGTAFWIYSNWNLNTTDSYFEYGRWRWCWYNTSNYNYNVSAAENTTTYSPRSTHSLGYKFVVRRTSPLAPTLVDDTATNGGKIDSTTRTKTANFEGQPVKITISHDFGSGIITYSYDSTVTLVTRSQHGVNAPNTSNPGNINPNGKNLVFQSSTAGLHIIKIRLVQPATSSIAWPSTQHNANSNSGTMISTKMSWSDTTATEIEFRLQINMQSTKQPSLVADAGVNGARSKKTVNYNGQYQTISFKDADKNFVGWSANGMLEKSWDNNGNLVLQQKERGVYTINLFLKNPAGCLWSDDLTTVTLQFTFEIKEMLIEKPTQVGASGSYSKTVTFDETDQVMSISPIVEEQVIIIAPGLQVSYSGGQANFTMRDVNSVNIIVMPAEGYLWSDGSKDPINFYFTIEAMEITAPYLEPGPNVNGTTKTVTFDPYGTQSLVISNVIEGSVVLVTALQNAMWDSANKTVTLYATNANTYPVNVELASNNYKWASTMLQNPRFELIVERYVLESPHIAENTKNNPAIEGATKTVYYNPVVGSDNSISTLNKDKYFELFVGGFTQGNGGFFQPSQIQIRYSQVGLLEEWACGHSGHTYTNKPYLTLWGTKKAHPADDDMSLETAGPAGNYIIYITPTANYMWSDGTNDMYTFKFVITPIMRDQLPMQVPQASGNAWTEVGDRMGTAVYNGREQYFRIGSPDNPALFFDLNQVEEPTVEYKPASPTITTLNGGFKSRVDYDYPEIKNESDPSNPYKPVILVCSAVESGTYIVRLQLRNHNYAWRDGSGIDIYYTFTIEPQSLTDPTILVSESRGNDAEIGDYYIYCTYDGLASRIAISIPKIVDNNGESIIGYTFNEEDIDPDTGKRALNPVETDGNIADLGRLIFEAFCVGDHSVFLAVLDPNFKWASGVSSFEFVLMIDPAEVADILFNYGSPDGDEPLDPIGGRDQYYEATYDTHTSHYITVTRSNKDYKDTIFKSQFRYEISYFDSYYTVNSVDDTRLDCLVLEFSSANTYYISIYPTTNYRWKSTHKQDAVQMALVINPKIVDLPTIIDDGTAVDINNVDRRKTVDYDALTMQSISLDLGDDWEAYKVDENQNTSSLKNATVSAGQIVRYTAQSAGTYVLALVLSHTNNYEWSDGRLSSEDTVFYTLEIRQRAVSLPDVFYVSDASFIDDIHEDYVKVKAGVDSDGKKVSEKLGINIGEYDDINDVYNTKLHYVYLFGYAVVNGEISITVTPNDARDLSDGRVSVGGEIQGYYVYFKYANVYKITISFNLNSEFNRSNCYWDDVPDLTSTLSRTITVNLDKLGLALPVIQEDRTQSWAADANGNDSLTRHVTYSETTTGPSIHIENCKSSIESAPFMTYKYDEALTTYSRNTSTDVLTFSILKTANVGTTYLLTIGLDADNEYWINPAVTDDTSIKNIYIVIDKLGVKMPVRATDSDGANYSIDAYTKAFTYDVMPKTYSLTVTNCEVSRLTYSTNSNITTVSEGIDNYVLTTNIVNGASVNVGTYSITLSLRDSVNLKWIDPSDPTSDSSDPLTFRILIEPLKIPKPFISTLDSDPANPGFISADKLTAETTYWKGHEQTIVIENFRFDNDNGIGSMKVVNNSTDKFTVNQTDEINKLLTYGATAAGTYVVTFSLSGNLAWDDGSGAGDVKITLIIHKMEYTAPTIDGTVGVSGNTKTVTYNFGAQQIVINDYNDAIMSYYGTESDPITHESLDNKYKAGDTEYTLEATGAGTYTVTFALRDYKNECWSGINSEYIKFTFIIDKLHIDIPKIDGSEFLLVGESVDTNGLSFTTTYDTLRHSALVLNVLGTKYMTFAMGYNYNSETRDTFVISDEAIPASYVYSGTNKVCQTVDEVFNVNSSTKRNGSFQSASASILSHVDKDNFILMEATEPGTYNVVFTLANSLNICWSDNSVTTKTVSFIIEKVKIIAPTYKPGANNSVAYTGSPIKFYVANANNGQTSASTTPAFYYEVASYRCVSDSTKSIELVSWYGSELIVQATQIGTYEVTVRISDTKHVTWTNSSATYATFNFTIRKCDIKPVITYGNAVTAGATDSVTNAALAAGATKWSKSTTVTATITLPNIRLAVGKSPIELDVDGLALEIYYYNTSASAFKLLPSGVVAPPKDVTSTLLTGLTVGGGAVHSATDARWSVELTSSGLYNLYFEYEILPDPSNCYDPDPTVAGDETLLMGTYTIVVEQNGTSNNYSISSESKNFTIEADPAPFTTANADEYIIWEVYLVSNPDTPIETYALSDFTAFTKWGGVSGGMTAKDAISLPYLDSDSYIIKVNFDANGLQGPDASATPATVFTEALLRWHVKWNGVYGGKSNAKYVDNYEVSITITALDSNVFSFNTVTYKFYYKISPILYDLNGVTWDYTGPFVYDGTPKTVKLKNLPTGLSVASYDVTGYDRNVQTYARSQAEHGAKYVTHVTFTTSNKNYLVPVEGNTATYLDTGATKFQWYVEWEIKKQKLSVDWDNTKSEDGTSSVYVPTLKTHGEKVDYTYYIDNGDPDHNNWDLVTSFDHTGYVDFKVVATLKTSSDAALNYANNYYLEFPNEASPTDNYKIFTLGPSTYINVELFIGNLDKSGRPDMSTYSQLQADTDPAPGINMFYYNGSAFEVYLSDSSAPNDATVKLTGAPSTINIWDNLIINYYSTVNEYRPISAPVEPGHYLIRLQLTNLPDDGNSYKLAKTDFYFDIEKGTIDPDSYYWRYTHTDTSGKQYVAKYDFTDEKWIILYTSDSVFNSTTGQYEDPAGMVPGEIGQELVEFVYDTKVHSVEIYSENPSILGTTTRNMNAIDAGSYTSTVAFAYNGKFWNDPTIQTTFNWKIEKAVISLAGFNWTDTSGFVYTVSGGVVKSYTVTATGLDPLLASYLSYKTTDLNGATVANVLSNAGTYITTLTISNFDEENPNYKLGNDWPSTVPNPITWTIERREIEVPEANGSWTEFDGKQHDLLTTVSLENDWAEYFTLSISYKALTAGAGFVLYNGTSEFGNIYFASHAGDYQFTFSLISSLNAGGYQNVVWKVNNGYGYDYVVTNQSGIIMPVSKATMTVEGWIPDGEASTVVLSGDYASNEFVDYKFYYNQTSSPAISIGAAVDLGTILMVTQDTEFVMEVYVKSAYANDIYLSGGVKGLQFAFNKIAPSSAIEDQNFITRMPYIEGYSWEQDGNVYTTIFSDEDWMDMYVADTVTFSDITAAKKTDPKFDWSPYLGGTDDRKINETATVNKSLVRINLTYTGYPITFIIHDWSTGIRYEDDLRIWQGNLTQSKAGDYSVTLLFKTDNVNPRSWAVDTDGDGVPDTIDRSPLTLKFRISYKMIYPYKDEIEANFPTYTGSVIDILEKVLGEDEYAAWIGEYGKYFEIIGSKGTDANGYTLQLKIKDEYLEMVRWYNGDNATGQPGTFSIKWRILPVYVPDPESLLGSGVSLIYDGNEHSIFEIMDGYSSGGDSMSDDLKALIQYAIITDDRGVNANKYTAHFTLPSINYAWLNTFDRTPSSNKDTTRNMDWVISPQKLDMSGIAWNYDPTNPFVYTLENGSPVDHELLLIGIPAALNDFISYLTDGDIGNARSEVGTYFTVVYLFRNDIKESSNYELIETAQVTNFRAAYPDPDGYGYVAISWKIVQRQFTPPVNNKQVAFNGVARDVIEDADLLAFGKGWENYFDISIEFKLIGEDDDMYVSYYDIANVDKLLNYSMYNVLYVGNYRIKFSIKSSLNKDADRVAWIEAGNVDVLDRTVILTINPLEINLTGWAKVMDDDKVTQVSGAIVSTEFSKLSEDSQALFEYTIRDLATGEEVTKADVKSRGNGIYYTVEFAIKDPDSYAALQGFEIVWKTDKIYKFINENFGTQSVIWLPLPDLVYPAKDEYDGKDKVYMIKNIDDYALTDTMKDDLYNNYGVDVRDYDSLLEAIAISSKFLKVDLVKGTVTIEKAGEYSMVLRLLPNVNLSWYDKKLYPTPNASTPKDRYAKRYDFVIEKAIIPGISQDMIESFEALIPDFEYTAREWDLEKEVPALFDLLKKLYGDKVKFRGTKATDAGEHTLWIELTDPDSSYWNLNINETLTVNDPKWEEYDPSYSLKYVKVNEKWVVKYVKDDGKGGFIDYNDGDYKLEIAYVMRKSIDSYVEYDSLFDEDGNLLASVNKAHYEVDENGDFVKYSYNEEDDVYEVDENGTFVVKYKLKPGGSGELLEMPETDSEGRMLVDFAKTKVKITRIKTTTEPYAVKWYITGSKVSAPKLNNKELFFNGEYQSVEDAVDGFNASYMEIIEGGLERDAGEYVAKIGISDSGFDWRDDPDVEFSEDGKYVIIRWSISKATVDMSGVSWRFTDGTKEYKNGEGMVYTLIGGKAVVYRVELVNVPAILKSSIEFTTNGARGAYAGRDAGVYYTSFAIRKKDDNFEYINFGDLKQTIEWIIHRRELELPELGSTKYIFDDASHDLFGDLTLPDNWEEYITIEVQYASDFVHFYRYSGHDGKPYEAFGAGAYKFVVAIKDGINTDASNPSVVWKSKNSAQPELPDVGEDETPEAPEVSEGEEEESETPATLIAFEIPEEEVVVYAVETPDAVEEDVYTVTEVPTVVHPHTETAKVTVAQQICDRVKELVYCAQVQLQSFRRFVK